jgi:hypothetical protein
VSGSVSASARERRSKNVFKAEGRRNVPFQFFSAFIGSSAAEHLDVGGSRKDGGGDSHQEPPSTPTPTKDEEVVADAAGGRKKTLSLSLSLSFRTKVGEREKGEVEKEGKRSDRPNFVPLIRHSSAGGADAPPWRRI